MGDAFNSSHLVAHAIKGLMTFHERRKGFAFRGLLAVSGNRGFRPNNDTFAMTVYSSVSNHLKYNKLFPRPRKSTRDYKKLKEAMTIVTNGSEKVFATASGTTCGCIIDQPGQHDPVRILTMFVHGTGRNVFSSFRGNASRGKH